MSRPVDHDEEFSSRNVVLIGWTGDENVTYDSLRTALRYMLESGRIGYVVFGSDIGGYRFDHDRGPFDRTKEVFLRPNIYVVPVTHDPSPGRIQRVWSPKKDTSSPYRIPLYVEQNAFIPMYDMKKKSSSLYAFRFVSWVKMIINQQTTTLSARDGQQWLLKLDNLKQKLTIQLIEQYESGKKKNVKQQEVCVKDWIKLV
ncbi:unnamed protein product [Adineta ricciae]|uniref:Glycoside hydrolase family 31 TIM barrel domain-containing protein n=1 Tax=Adineta ricciae TaxID=249248 RepID=A0A815V929_ADIRI|nr:unnamed protein product [Adineta ricciae]CAF1529975.1 unnamed protein product [Adineta ricciae]